MLKTSHFDIIPIKNSFIICHLSFVMSIFLLAMPPVLAADAEYAFSQGKSYYQQNQLDSAVAWLRQAAEQGHIEAQALLGSIYHDQNQFTQAAPWLAQAAEQGQMNAQALLGSMYLVGRGLPKAANQAIYWLTKAANQEHAEAQSLLGAIYLVGKDAPQDLVKARRWIRKSAQQGLADAQFLLGKMYYQGNGVTANQALAEHWLSLAAAQGHQSAIMILRQFSPPTAKITKLKNKYRLTVNAAPADSRIRIMNIVPKYRPGIALEPGQYDIYITRPGYLSYRRWIEVNDADLSIDIVLTKKN